MPSGASGLSTARVTRFGSNPASASTRRATRTDSAMGRMPVGCGLTITALPVARLANIAGNAFQVGKVAQVKQTATPRGTSRKRFCNRIVAAPKRRSHKASGGHRGHRLVRVGDGLDAAVECIRAAARIAHGGALAGGVHHGGHQLRQFGEQGLHDLQADADSRLRAGVGPGGHGLARGIEQDIDVGPRVVDAEPLARVGRDLVTEPPDLRPAGRVRTRDPAGPRKPARPRSNAAAESG